MKKFLPLLMFVLLAFVGCQPKPATYVDSEDPQTMLTNCEKFVNYTFDKSSKYTAEDWDVTVEQFVHMCKNYRACEWQLFEKDRERFQLDLNKFMQAVDATGNTDLALEIKAKYAEVMER